MEIKTPRKLNSVGYEASTYTNILSRLMPRFSRFGSGYGDLCSWITRHPSKVRGWDSPSCGLRHKRFSAKFYCTLLVVTGWVSAQGATIVWTNTAGGNWSAAVNWSPNLMPSINDSAYITNNGTYTVTLDVAASITAITLGGASGTQTLTVNNPMLILSGAGVVNANGVFGLSGGTLAGAGSLTTDGALNWTSGTISITNVTVNNTLTINGVQEKNLYGCTLINIGTANWSGGDLSLYNSAMITNAPGGTFNVMFAGEIDADSGSPLFANAGTFSVAAGVGSTAYFEVNFNNSSVVSITSGTLSLGVGGTATSAGSFSIAAGSTLDLSTYLPYDLPAGSSVSGAGNFSFHGEGATLNENGTFNVSGTNYFFGGTANFGGNYTINGSTLNISGGTANFMPGGTIAPGVLNVYGGTLIVSNMLSVSGLTTWTGGTIQSKGTFNPLGGLTISSGEVTLYSCALINTASANLSGATLSLYNSPGITNSPGGTFNITTGGSIENYSGHPVIANAGTFNVGAGATLASIGVVFNNSGTLSVNSGTLVLAVYSQTAGLTLLNGGNIESPYALQIDGGVLGGSGTVFGSVTNSGIVDPGNPLGKLIIDGNYFQTASGTLGIALAGTLPGTNFDLLVVTNIASLAGALNVTLTNGFIPPNGAFFTFLSAGTCSNSFDSFLYPSNLLGIQINYTMKTALLLVYSNTPAPDLAPASFVPATNNIVLYPPRPQFPTVQVSFTVTNQGTGVASGSWNDVVYVSTNTTIAGAISSANYQAPSSVLAGGEYGQTNFITLPQQSGTYYLLLSIDDSHSLYEGNYSNNVASAVPITVTYQVMAPDLQVVSVSVPQEAWTGRSFDVSWVLTNAGAGLATGLWDDRVYLSATNVLRTNLDQVLGDFEFEGQLAPGQTVDLTQPVTINSTGVSNALYYVSVLTDFSNDVFEVTKTNNVGISLSNIYVHVTPLQELVIASVDAPNNGIGGQPVGVSWIICNQGQADTEVPIWYDHLYLSTTTNLAGVIEDYGEYENPSYLAPGDCYEQDVIVTLPVGISGPFYFIVNADATGQVDVDNITNNLGSAPLPINIQLVTPGFLHVASVQVAPAPPTEVLAGQLVTVTWTVENTGQSPITSTWDDEVTLSPNPVYDFVHGYWDVINHIFFTGPLAPGQSYSHTNQFIVPQGIAPGSWYAVPIVNTHYLASGNGAVGSGNIGRDQNSALVLVSAPPPSDLVVTSVSAPNTGYAGEPINVSWVVSNQGLNGTSSGDWLDGVYLSTNGVFDTNQDLLLGSFLETGGTLDIGASYTREVSVTLPASLLPAGASSATNYLFVYADILNSVYEITKTNNVLEATNPLIILPAPPPGSPDLAVTSVSASSTILAGGPVNVFWKVTNEGADATGSTSWVDSVYLSPDGTFDTNADIWLADIPLNGSLASGDSYTVAKNLNTPYCTMGKYFVVIVTDSGYQVNQAGAVSNNVLASPNPLHILPNNAARLEVSSVSSASSVTAGAPLTVSWTVANSGNSTANASWIDGIFLSASPFQLDGDGYLLGIYTNQSNLVSGESYSRSNAYTLPPCFAGKYYVTVVADLSNVVDSISCDTNNATTAPEAVQVLSTAYPSLQIAALALPTAVTSGVPWVVQWSVTNAGPGAASGTWFDAVYASLSPTLDTSAILLGEFKNTDELAPDGMYSQSQLVQIPPCTAGQYFIFVATDVSNAVNSSACQVNNLVSSTNALQVNFDLYPQLGVSAVSIPATASAGQPMTISWTVTNGGLATANSPWVDAVYLTADGTFNPANDSFLGYYTEATPLAPGASRTQSASFTLPGLYGNFYVAVFTDAKFAVFQCDGETNQVAISTTLVNVPITQYPKLNVTSVQVPANAFAGQPITVTWVVTNNGTASTGGAAWNDAVYLSTDEVLGSYAVRLGNFMNVSSLGVGQSYTNSATLVIPPGNAGPFYILILADSGSVLYDPLGYNDRLGLDPDAILVTLPPPADLAASDVTLAPATGVPSTLATIGWTVSNVSPNATVSEWSDDVYVSTNNYWDPTATLLTNVNHTGLAAVSSYSGSWTGPLQALTPGSYYAIVRADVRNTVPETNLMNNVAVSPNTISIDVPIIALGQTVTNALTTGGAQYYKVNCPAGQTVNVTLNGASTNSFNELYARYGAVPDLGAYDFIYNSPLAPNQQITIPTTQAGWYYIMVRGGNEPGGPLGYSLAANIVPFSITSVTPNQIGDSGQVTITVRGALFQSGASVQLVSGNTVYPAATNFFNDVTSISARFFFTNAIHGTFDVVLTNPDQKSTKDTQAITIETALPLTTQVVPNGPVNLEPRLGLPFNWVGAVVNAGNVDIQYMTAVVSANPQFPIALTPPLEAIVANTNSIANPAGACAFIARDLPPGGSLDFSFIVSGFGVTGFDYFIVTTNQFKQDFLLQVANDAEAVRDFISTNANALTFTTTNASGIITTNSLSVPNWLATVLANTNTWKMFFAQALFSGNLIDSNDVSLLPAPSVALSPPSFSYGARDAESCTYCMVLHHTVADLITEQLLEETIECLEVSAGCLFAGPECFGVCMTVPILVDVSVLIVNNVTSEECEQENCGQPPPAGPPGFEVKPRPPKDPNEKQGPVAYSAASFVGSQEQWQYTIYFENTSNAPAFARQVTINDVLDPSLDIRTFRVGNIVLGNTNITVPANMAYFQTRITLPPPNPPNVVADITAGVNVQNRSLFWTMNAIDLNTGQLVTDAQEGVLPPNTTNNVGAAYVTYSIKPLVGVATGTIVTNQASIVFDINDPIPTDTTTNTVDALSPTSKVAALSPVINSNNFMVSWSGMDDPGGSGVASFNIFYSDNGGPYQVWLAKTTSTSAQFTGQFGHSYAFFCVAQDNSGNVEAVHSTPDTTTLVSSPPVIAPVADQTVNVGTAVVITNTVSQADLPAPSLTYSLGPNAPTGATVNPTNGVFIWTPECAQGSTTNLIEVLVTASDNPAVTNSMFFNVVVGDCVQVGVGSAVVQTGKSTSIPVNLFTTVGLTNLSFTLVYPTNRFSNWTISVTNPVGSIGASQMLGPSNTFFSLAALGGQWLPGPTVAGSLNFSALPGQSAIIPLSFMGFAGTKADGSPAGNISGQPGRVVVIGSQPLLEAWLSTNAQRKLTLYGNPGAGYEVDYAANILGANWQCGWRVPMTNMSEVFSANASLPQVFYRAFEFSANPPVLEFNSFAQTNLTLLLYGQNGSNYMIVSGTNLLSTLSWPSIAGFTLTNSFQFINAGGMTNRVEFFRAKRQ